LSRFDRNDVLAAGQDDTSERDLVHGADHVADHGERIDSDLALGRDVVGTRIVEIIDLFLRNKLIDVDCARAL